jgi:hypothetical protein
VVRSRDFVARYGENRLVARIRMICDHGDL